MSDHRSAPYNAKTCNLIEHNAIHFSCARFQNIAEVVFNCTEDISFFKERPNLLFWIPATGMSSVLINDCTHICGLSDFELDVLEQYIIY